jgi:murein DD-endopeptidase MepM/ murein hydrolase activator NlpD
MPSPESLCEPAPGGLYCVYTVRPDDSLSGIGIFFGLSGSNGLTPAEILAASNQPDVVDSNQIIPGQKLRISKSGIIHTVITAETPGQLAADYGTTSDAISTANGGDDTFVIGQEVLIPGPSRVPAVTVAAPEATPTATATPQAEPAAADTPEPEATLEPTAIAQATATPTFVPPTVTPARRTPTPRPGTPTATPRLGGGGSSRFIWPATGPISSYFGPSHPLGIDIDFFHNPNQPVVASAGGLVSFAGGTTCCSYGLYVVIEHADGFTTLYAHLSQVSVSAGQVVNQGQVIGLGGRSGYATGNHLHFEIRRDGNVTNPLAYLP